MNQKHTLVVGGTRGLGREFVRYFRSKGHVVSVVSRNLPKTKVDNSVFYFRADISKERPLLAALKQCVAKAGPLDTVVLAQRYRGDDVWNGEFSTTLGATRNTIEFAKNHFHAAGSKAVLVISSVAGRYFIDDQPVGYHMSKAALEQLVRYYAVELGPKGIRVNGVAPCAFVKEESRDFYMKNKKIQAFYRSIAPLKRMVTTQDITYLGGALSHPDCYVTGQVIVMDGGISLLWPEAAAKRVK